MFWKDANHIYILDTYFLEMFGGFIVNFDR